jgi:hypothetical protein
MPTTPLSYALVNGGTSVLCGTSVKSGTPQSNQGSPVMWCPNLKAIVILPTVLIVAHSNQLYLGGAAEAYTQALAVANGKVAPSFAACYHGAIARQMPDRALAVEQLHQSYAGTTLLPASAIGYTWGICFPEW